MQLLLVILPCRVGSPFNDYVINHTRMACVYVINTHARAGFDRSLDDSARLVHNVTCPVENITARIIRPVLANNERFYRLITGGRAFLSRRSDDRSRYRYCFCGSCFLSFMRRTRLRKRQRRNQRAGDSNNCSLHDAFLLMLMVNESVTGLIFWSLFGFNQSHFMFLP